MEVSEKSVNRKVIVWYKHLQPTSGFTQAGVYARRHFCADLEVCRPPEPLWNPRLREAATTLAASERADSAVIDESNELDTELLSPVLSSIEHSVKFWKSALLIKFCVGGTEIHCLTDFVNGRTINSLASGKRAADTNSNFFARECCKIETVFLILYQQTKAPNRREYWSSLTYWKKGNE